MMHPRLPHYAGHADYAEFAGYVNHAGGTHLAMGGGEALPYQIEKSHVNTL